MWITKEAQWVPIFQSLFKNLPCLWHEFSWCEVLSIFTFKFIWNQVIKLLLRQEIKCIGTKSKFKNHLKYMHYKNYVRYNYVIKYRLLAFTRLGKTSTQRKYNTYKYLKYHDLKTYFRKFEWVKFIRNQILCKCRFPNMTISYYPYIGFLPFLILAFTVVWMF